MNAYGRCGSERRARSNPRVVQPVAAPVGARGGGLFGPARSVPVSDFCDRRLSHVAEPAQRRPADFAARDHGRGHDLRPDCGRGRSFGRLDLRVLRPRQRHADLRRLAAVRGGRPWRGRGLRHRAHQRPAFDLWPLALADRDAWHAEHGARRGAHPDERRACHSQCPQRRVRKRAQRLRVHGAGLSLRRRSDAARLSSSSLRRSRGSSCR